VKFEIVLINDLNVQQVTFLLQRKTTNDTFDTAVHLIFKLEGQKRIIRFHSIQMYALLK